MAIAHNNGVAGLAKLQNKEITQQAFVWDIKSGRNNSVVIWWGSTV